MTDDARLSLTRPAGGGWLALIGGGEFSFGETEFADEAWLEKTPEGTIGFVPAASGSVEYGENFRLYMWKAFEREVTTVPVYRVRDARRGKNCERIERCVAAYLGGGITDHLVEAILDTPFTESLLRVLREGGVVVAIASAAQALGAYARSIERETMGGLQWLPGGVIEPNFDPGHDRRLRELMGQPGVRWGLGIPAGSAVLLGPDDEVEIVGSAFHLGDVDGEFTVLEEQ